MEKETSWETIDKMLHHLFTGEDYDRAIAYLHTLYTQHESELPVLILWSDEQCTGKTSFLHLLKAMFGEDMTIIDAARLESNFNGLWAGKPIIGVDEAFIDTDNTALVRQLKKALTSPTIQVENKGRKPKEIANHSWVFCTNEDSWINKVAPFTALWSVKTKPIPKEDIDPHLWEHIQIELPEFLNYLKKQPLKS